MEPEMDFTAYLQPTRNGNNNDDSDFNKTWSPSKFSNLKSNFTTQSNSSQNAHKSSLRQSMNSSSLRKVRNGKEIVSDGISKDTVPEMENTFELNLNQDTPNVVSDAMDYAISVLSSKSAKQDSSSLVEKSIQATDAVHSMMDSAQNVQLAVDQVLEATGRANKAISATMVAESIAVQEERDGVAYCPEWGHRSIPYPTSEEIEAWKQPASVASSEVQEYGSEFADSEFGSSESDVVDKEFVKHQQSNLDIPNTDETRNDYLNSDILNTDESKNEQSNLDTPSTDDLKNEQSTLNQSSTDESKSQQSTLNQSSTDESKTQQSNVETPNTDVSSLQQEGESDSRQAESNSKEHNLEQTGDSRWLDADTQNRNSAGKRDFSALDTSLSSVATDGDQHELQAIQNETPRLCKRFLCNIGCAAKEELLFQNSSSSTVQISCLLIPLGVGCQQFSIVPNVLELQANQNGCFVVSFSASILGAVACIVQFKSSAASLDSPPYEIMLDASVKKPQHLIQADVPQKLQPNARFSNVSSTKGTVDIHPTFLKFSKSEFSRKLLHHSTQPENALSIMLSNTTSENVPFKLECPHDNVRLSKKQGHVYAGSTKKIYVWPISRPFVENEQTAGISYMSKDGSWNGTLSIVLNGEHRDLSIAFDKELLQALPEMVDLARSFGNISQVANTREPNNSKKRDGLYFSSKRISFGPCSSKERHQVLVKLCNGSHESMSVFLQKPHAPFYIRHVSITLRPRTYVKIPIFLKGHKAGKFTTNIEAFSLSERTYVQIAAQIKEE